MADLQRLGVQEIPGERNRWLIAGSQFPRRPVQRIANHRMTQGGEVDANLVSTASVNLDFHSRELSERRFDTL